MDKCRRKRCLLERTFRQECYDLFQDIQLACRRIPDIYLNQQHSRKHSNSGLSFPLTRRNGLSSTYIERKASFSFFDKEVTTISYDCSTSSFISLSGTSALKYTDPIFLIHVTPRFYTFVSTLQIFNLCRITLYTAKFKHVYIYKTKPLVSHIKNQYVQAVLRGLKPCVIGIVLATGIDMVITNAFSISSSTVHIQAMMITVFLIVFILGYQRFVHKKLSPITVIMLSALTGIVIYGI